MMTIKLNQLSAFLLLASRSATTTAFSQGRPGSNGIGILMGAARTQYLASTQRAMLGYRQRNFQRHMSTSGSGAEPGEIRHIGRQEMEQILKEHEEMIQAELESPYFILDVRTPGEVDATGKLAPSVPTLPVQVMGPPYNALQMDDEDFEESFGFAKPSKDKIMVFSCAAGIRSVTACKLAQQAGYTECTNYMGGANEWFAPS
jgi:rhodanese-related sulfurtransferase